MRVDTEEYYALADYQYILSDDNINQKFNNVHIQTSFTI